MKPLTFFVDNNGCWIVNSHKTNVKGRPRKKEKGIMQFVHRTMYKKYKGDIPKGICVCRKCDNAYCCNPDHLFLGTYIDSMQNAVNKGKTARGIRHGRCKITEEIAKEIKFWIKQNSCTMGVIASRMGVTYRIVANIKYNHTWKWVEVD